MLVGSNFHSPMDIFDMFFGGSSRRSRGPAKGKDVIHQIKVLIYNYICACVLPIVLNYFSKWIRFWSFYSRWLAIHHGLTHKNAKVNPTTSRTVCCTGSTLTAGDYRAGSTHYPFTRNWPFCKAKFLHPSLP